jgi:BMFP domain-containing protein YqiC
LLVEALNAVARYRQFNCPLALRPVVKFSFDIVFPENTMIPKNAWFEEFQKNVSDLIARSPAADIERNVKAFMGQAFNKMDLITREEFDIQVDMLKRVQERAAALEEQVQQLEQRMTLLESGHP